MSLASQLKTAATAADGDLAMRHLASKAVLEQRFRDILTFVNDYCGPAATLPPENTAITNFSTTTDMRAVLNALALKDNPVLTRTVGIALRGTLDSYHGYPLSYACHGYTPAESYTAALGYIDEFRSQLAAGANYQSKYQFPALSAAGWINNFADATKTAQQITTQQLAAITDPALSNLQNPPRISLLDDECAPVATLQTVPRRVSTLDADRETASRKVRGPQAEITLAELLTKVSNTELAGKTRVEHYNAALPAYPNQGTVNFLVQLDRGETPQQVFILAGNRELRGFPLLEKGNLRIQNSSNKVTVSFGVPQKGQLGTSEESPLTASVGDALTAARKEQLLRELGMEESCSAVVVLIPGTFAEPEPIRFREDSSSRSFSLSAAKGMHTGFGTSTTGSKFMDSGREVFSPAPSADKPVRIVILHCAGVPETAPE